MEKRNVLISCSIVLLMVMGVLTVAVPSGHAVLTGTVCIQPPGVTGCTPTAPTIGGAAGKNVTVNVNIAASDTLGGIQISVIVDPTILNPVSIATTGTVVPGSFLTLVECINGASFPPTAGNGCNPNDMLGVASLGISSLGSLTVPPTTGLLFSITYNILTTTTGTPISFQSDPVSCAGQSVAGTNLCVLVTAGSASQPETVVGANFVNAAATTSLVAVVSGTDGNLYWSPFAGTTWGAWSALGGQSPSSPGLCVTNSTAVELVVRGTDQSIYHKTFSSSTNTWQSTWDKNPIGLTIDGPACAVLGRTMYLVIRGAADEIFATTFDLNLRTWTSWTDLGGSTPTVPALVATSASSRLDLVVMGDNKGIYHKAFTAGAWAAAWDSPATPNLAATIATPAIASDGTQIHVVVRGTESNIWYATVSFAGVWSGFTSLVGSTPNAPTLVIDSANTLHVLIRGFDNQLYSKGKTSTGAWDATWASAGGILASAPAAAATPSGVSALVQGVDNTVWYNTLSGTTWSGYSSTLGQSSIGPAESGV